MRQTWPRDSPPRTSETTTCDASGEERDRHTVKIMRRHRDDVRSAIVVHTWVPLQPCRVRIMRS
jgi:hypothetical protein